MRVLFASMPAQSHIAPMLPLACAMSQAGHDVVFATGPDAVAAPRGAGLRTLSAGLRFAEVRRRYAEASGSELAALSPQKRIEHLLLHGLIGIAAPAMAEDLLPFADTWQPEALIGNPGEWGSEIVATAVGVPHVIHGFSSPKSGELLAVLREGLAEVYEGCGIDPPSGDSHLTNPYLDIWPQGLRPQTDEWLYPNMWPLRPENALPLAAPAPRPDALSGLPHERTVYVTAGTTHNTTTGLLETMVQGLREEAVNVVVTIGPDGDPDRFGPQPDHVRIERYIPQNTLLPHCELVVCSAGAGTVLGALAHATPLVVAPVATDQHEMAEQVQQAGVGRTCCTQPLSPAAVRASFQEVSTNPAYSAAAARLSEQILSMPTPADLLPRLDELVASDSHRRPRNVTVADAPARSA